MAVLSILHLEDCTQIVKDLSCMDLSLTEKEYER